MSTTLSGEPSSTRFEDLTGEALVVNTSFNLAGEPLVEAPQDALRSFAVGGLDALYLQG